MVEWEPRLPRGARAGPQPGSSAEAGITSGGGAQGELRGDHIPEGL